MTKKLNWRLGKLPSPDEVRELVKDKIITQDEARDILFSEQEETERDVKSLESEIKFLRELVEKLSKGSTSQVVETIRYIEKPYTRYPWYVPYQTWCSSGNSLVGVAYANSASVALNTTATGAGSTSNVSGRFSSINTF